MDTCSVRFGALTALHARAHGTGKLDELSLVLAGLVVDRGRVRLDNAERDVLRVVRWFM